MSRPLEVNSICDTISNRLFREIWVNSLNNVGEASGEGIQEIGGIRGFDAFKPSQQTS